jgi:glycine hydroxymethyltransferase
MSLKNKDPQIYKLIKQEEKRQIEQLEMIPSENYTSADVIEAMGSVLTNNIQKDTAESATTKGINTLMILRNLLLNEPKSSLA